MGGGKERRSLLEFKKLLLSLPSSMVDLLDEAAIAFGMCRSDIIRRSLARDLAYVISHELPSIQRFHQQTSTAHRSWLF